MIKINSKGYIEPKVGSEFKNPHDDEMLRTIVLNSEDNSNCGDCVFSDSNICPFACDEVDRDDNTDVIFKIAEE